MSQFDLALTSFVLIWVTLTTQGILLPITNEGSLLNIVHNKGTICRFGVSAGRVAIPIIILQFFLKNDHAFILGESVLCTAMTLSAILNPLVFMWLLPAFLAEALFLALIEIRTN